MTKKIQNQEEIAVAEAVSKTEKFFEEHGKKVIVALVALLIVFAGGYAYKYLVLDKNEAAANELIIKAQDRFKGDDVDYQLVLNGDENGAGLLELIEQYGSTTAGNIACQYAGICYLRLGEFDNAEKYLKMYDAVGGSVGALIVDAQNLGLQGDVQVEKGNYAEAAKLYGKAVKVSENEFTAPYYLLKQAQAHYAAGNKEAARECYKAVTEKYSNTLYAREAEGCLGL